MLLFYQPCLQNQAADETKTKHNNLIGYTYSLKRDVYNCCIKARENKSNGYMKRLKSYWDELYTEFTFLSDKNLSCSFSYCSKQGCHRYRI